MGTNYYLNADPPCAHCGRGPERGAHIGKSSAGWCFSLRVYPEGVDSLRPINDLDDWRPLFEQYGVVDEYGRETPVASMLMIITERTHPLGLQRHPIDDRYIAHPDGTYDLVIGDFS